jgi:hypothetical protein
MKAVRDEWGTRVFPIATDASGESRKARGLLGIKYLLLVVLNCYAHQVPLQARRVFSQVSFEMASHHARLALVDDNNLNDNEAVTAPQTIGRPIPIQELFDFRHAHWVDSYAKSARRNFDEELELYELLDLDAEGEEDVDVDIDDSTADILIG